MGGEEEGICKCARKHILKGLFIKKKICKSVSIPKRGLRRMGEGESPQETIPFLPILGSAHELQPRVTWV